MNEVSIIGRIIESLAAAGPVALVLGGVCWKLWQQNLLLLTENKAQQVKMLRLAVRVQRAVEALAGLEAPAIEADLGDDEETITK